MPLEDDMELLKGELFTALEDDVELLRKDVDRILLCSDSDNFDDFKNCLKPVDMSKEAIRKRFRDI
jgi:hypothetical protein